MYFIYQFFLFLSSLEFVNSLVLAKSFKVPFKKGSLSLYFRYLLKALDMYWHEDCLKCGCCDCRLGEVGSTLYTKGNLLLCKRDYLR